MTRTGETGIPEQTVIAYGNVAPGDELLLAQMPEQLDQILQGASRPYQEARFDLPYIVTDIASLQVPEWDRTVPVVAGYDRSGHRIHAYVGDAQLSMQEADHERVEAELEDLRDFPTAEGQTVAWFEIPHPTGGWPLDIAVAHVRTLEEGAAEVTHHYTLQITEQGQTEGGVGIIFGDDGWYSLGPAPENPRVALSVAQVADIVREMHGALPLREAQQLTEKVRSLFAVARRPAETVEPHIAQVIQDIHVPADPRLGVIGYEAPRPDGPDGIVVDLHHMRYPLGDVTTGKPGTEGILDHVEEVLAAVRAEGTYFGSTVVTCQVVDPRDPAQHLTLHATRALGHDETEIYELIISDSLLGEASPSLQVGLAPQRACITTHTKRGPLQNYARVFSASEVAGMLDEATAASRRAQE